MNFTAAIASLSVIDALFFLGLALIIVCLSEIWRRNSGKTPTGMKEESLCIPNQSTSEYLALILHHIRTPLTGMMWGAKELWKNAPEGSSQKEGLLKMYDENVRILGAIEQLLQSSRVAAGRVSYNFEVTRTSALEQLILKGISEMSASAYAKNISLHIETRPLSNKPVKADAEKVMVVVQTLFENAVSYTDPGGNIAATIEETDGHFTFRISDTGMGIPKESEKNIFTQFYRATNAQKKAPTGYGVGLYLAKTFVSAHDGDITFAPNEKYGKGTIFTVRLPMLQR